MEHDGLLDLVERLSGGDDGRLVHLERLAGRDARHAATRRPLPRALQQRLPPGGLWCHQAEALDLVRNGTSVVLATGTASGKSLCYQLALGEAALDDPPGTAILLHPTKALAQDQLRGLDALDLPGVVAACYDGDTAPDDRAWVRRNATAVLTNPDMLHVGLLPHHGRWAELLTRLRYVVVDELHVLRGLFGTHVAHLLRRLRRVAATYGADPTFVFTSATIGEPARLASALCGLDVVAVTDDGSPRGERLFALWNPPMVDEQAGVRASANGETAGLVAELVGADHRAIAFCRSRRGTELVAADVKRRVTAELAPLVEPYRGGYLASERRELEASLFGGRLKGVVATSALELGIDIGGLDACVLDGFPGTVASMWQQVGRAGRSCQRSLAVLVAGEDQLDQWFMAHPEELFSREPEPAVVNPSNPFVLHPHLACAAYEAPLTPADDRYWGDDLDDGVRDLVLDDRMVVRAGRAFWSGRGSPAWTVGLRSGSSREFRISLPDGHLIGTLDESRAHEVVHPGAIYLHQGTSWQVDELDLQRAVAWVSPAPADEHTAVRSDTDIRILDDESCCRLGPVELHLGCVEVSSQVVGYQRRDLSGTVLATVALDLPPTCLVTRAFWYVVPPEVLLAAGVPPEDWPGTLHAAEHAGIGILPLFTICDRWDVGGVSTACQADTRRPTIVIYDGYPGGAGIAELGYAAGRRHLEATLEVVSSCPCTAGCPSCVQSPKCGNWNEPLHKAGAAALLSLVLST